jgi:hypothetical protein
MHCSGCSRGAVQTLGPLGTTIQLIAAEPRLRGLRATTRTLISGSSGRRVRGRRLEGRRERLWDVVSLCTLNGGAGEAYRCDTNALPASTILGFLIPLCLAERRRERRRDVTHRALPRNVAVTITRRRDELHEEQDKEGLDRPRNNEKTNTNEMHNENKQNWTNDKKKKRAEGKRTTTQLELGTSLRRRRVPLCAKRSDRYSLGK